MPMPWKCGTPGLAADSEQGVGHRWTPYGNPKVYPGCVRCHEPKAAHPAQPLPVITGASWRRIIREARNISVFAVVPVREA